MFSLPPLGSAICWKCYKTKTCDAQMCDLHRLIHRMCGSSWAKLRAKATVTPRFPPILPLPKHYLSHLLPPEQVAPLLGHVLRIDLSQIRGRVWQR
jgi:hypothetical protein